MSSILCERGPSLSVDGSAGDLIDVTVIDVEIERGIDRHRAQLSHGFGIGRALLGTTADRLDQLGHWRAPCGWQLGVSVTLPICAFVSAKQAAVSAKHLCGNCITLQCSKWLVRKEKGRTEARPSITMPENQMSLPIATAVSDIRFEKPHSLSYQVRIRHIAPSMTFVWSVWKIDEWGSWLKSMETSFSSV